ncbi:MAG: hypothetical protein QM768_20435 [Agriterribacter sp.]
MNKMKFSIIILSAALLLNPFFIAQAQEKIEPTNTLIITGAVKKEINFILNDLSGFPQQHIADVVITNHKGTATSELKNAKGISIKDLLKDVVLNTDSPKLYSEFYFVFTASDNYKVVYSWNEIFNTSTGDNIFIVTSIRDMPLKDMKNRILAVTTSDFRTGRRYVKGLREIKILRIQ